MFLAPPLPWKVSIEEAIKIQKDLAGKGILEDRFEKIESIVGVGISFSSDGKKIKLALATFSYPELKVKETQIQEARLQFPYQPGLFAFSVGPTFLKLIQKTALPDLIIFPGRGVIHPRGIGLATHLGIRLDLPTIACSKTHLSRDLKVPGMLKGNYALIKEKNKPVGAVLRTKSKVKPVYISIGHKISTATAINIILTCCTKYRMPEPLRYASQLSKLK